MSHHDCIRKSIDLKDRNINITFDHLFYEEQRIKEKKAKVYHASLTYCSKSCPCCGVVNLDYSNENQRGLVA